MNAHQGKFGWYPCDWATYRKLKALNLVYFKALQGKKRWERWERKDPKNRTIRGKLKDSAGRVVGYKAPLPMPEPEICPIFCEKIVTKVNFCKNGINITEVARVVIEDSLYDDYRNARYPKATKEEVQPLSLNLDTINQLYNKLK